MTYDFIAEFFRTKKDKVPLYRTCLSGNGFAASMIKKIGMSEEPGSTTGYINYIKETNQYELAEFFPFAENPEFESVIFDGESFSKVVLHAYGTESENAIGCNFGADKTIRVSFTGNKPTSRVRISYMDSPAKVDLPLRCFKEKMGVLTLYEVMKRFEKDYKNIDETSIELLGEHFASGLDRAIEIVGKEFSGDLDLDGNPELLHLTAVSAAGKNDDERLAGMLHDLIEEKDWTFGDLLNDGFPARIVDTLRLLTHDKQIPYMDYVRNICESGNEVALAVKINELNHNLKRGLAGGHLEIAAKHKKALSYIQEFMKTNNHDE